MTEIRNVPRRGGRLLTKVRGMYEHRAEWLYLLLDEARKKGLAWEDFAPEAILRCGRFNGAGFAGSPQDETRRGSPGETQRGSPNLVTLRRKGFGGLGRRVFEMKILSSGPDELDVEFHYCPLVSAWRKLGASEEELGLLCDIAMRGDAGIAEAFGARLELGQTIAKGGATCRVRFVKE